jgi:acyl-CoA thioester hydrolase
MMKEITEDAFLDDWTETLVRVRYAETDKMGVVYHANYLVWFEIGRTEYCRERGISYRDMEETGDAFLVVAESYCRYKAPAFYDDELIVRTHLTELRRRSMRFGYELLRATDDTVIAEGETGHVVTDSRGRVRTLPDLYRELLTTQPDDTATTQTGRLAEFGQPIPEDRAPD